MEAAEGWADAGWITATTLGFSQAQAALRRFC